MAACAASGDPPSVALIRPLALLNDSKQVTPACREELFRAVVASAERISVHVISPSEIDRLMTDLAPHPSAAFAALPHCALRLRTRSQRAR